MLSWSNHSIMEMPIFYKYKYFSLFKTGQFIGNSSFECMKK